MRNCRNKFGGWLERLTTVAVMLVVAASMYRAFWAPFPNDLKQESFSQLQQAANALRRESDPVRRDGESMAGDYRSLDGWMPTNARIFALDMLGPENFSKIGFYYYLNYYLYPREVAISLGQPPVFQLDGVTGREPASLEDFGELMYIGA